MPESEREARTVLSFYRKHGPLPREPFLAACARTAKSLGKGRPLSAYLADLERQISAHSDQGVHSRSTGAQRTMNPTPYPFHDFLRAKHQLQRALLEHHEPFALLTGDTGTGKTALLRELRADIDRARYRVVYFAQARKLGAVGLVKVLGESLRVRPSLCHALGLERLLRALAEDPRTLLLWLDEAHELPEETLAEARALTESDLEGTGPIQVLLIGLPKLRAQLQAQPALWRRIARARGDHRPALRGAQRLPRAPFPVPTAALRAGPQRPVRARQGRARPAPAHVPRDPRARQLRERPHRPRRGRGHPGTLGPRLRAPP